MMQDVANTDVVIVNSTHYTVALKYEQLRMTAPRLLAKGAGVVALNICQRAEQQGIPILEAAPLARALYRHCEIGGVIPVELYGAVAEMLALSIWLASRAQARGLRPRQPSKLTVPNALNCAKGSILMVNVVAKIHLTDFSQTRWQIFAGPVVIIMILSMMILPLPHFALDFFFSFNIVLSITILLVAIFT